MSDATVVNSFLYNSREVAESFLQTVVVVDDQAEMSFGHEGEIGRGDPDEEKSPGCEAVERTGNGDSNLRGASLDARAVINGFADIGSACAVMNPAPGEDFRERTVKAARRADIVVIDWKIHDSFGESALELVREILRADQDRLRLMAIYTGQPDLHEVLDRMKELVDEFYEEDELEEIGNFRLSKGPLNGVILAKEGTIGAYSPELSLQEVSEGDLADRLTDEFALLIGGLLRNTALAGIAAIRENSHRILAKFERGLDAAYLGHRLLLHHPPAAEDHLVAALGSELTSVLEECRPGAFADIGAIGKWLASEAGKDANLSEPFSFQKPESTADCWAKLLSLGIESGVGHLPANRRELRRRASEPFAESAEGAARSNRLFAALLSQRTRYPGRPPRLTMGTVVCEQGEGRDRYFLCLQPKCDSIRLAEASGFAMISLQPLGEVGVNAEGGLSLSLVVELGRDQWMHFGIAAKPSELTVRVFAPGPNPPGEVLAAREEAGRYCFEDTSGNRYCWLTSMKDEHALGIASKVASALSRPGPNEAEWLRRATGSPQ